MKLKDAYYTALRDKPMKPETSVDSLITYVKSHFHRLHVYPIMEQLKELDKEAQKYSKKKGRPLNSIYIWELLADIESGSIDYILD